MRQPIASIILPTLDAAGYAGALIAALHTQTIQATELIVMDSESREAHPRYLRVSGPGVYTVRREAFHHATTRNQAAELAEGSISSSSHRTPYPCGRIGSRSSLLRSSKRGGGLLLEARP